MQYFLLCFFEGAFFFEDILKIIKNQSTNISYISDPGSRIPLHLIRKQACYWMDVKVAQLLEKAESAMCNCHGFICNNHIHTLTGEHETNQTQDT